MQIDLNQKQNVIPQQNFNNNVAPKTEPLKGVNYGNRQTSSLPEEKESDEDPLLKEGYLPEIYFLLKSDNPADW